MPMIAGSVLLSQRSNSAAADCAMPSVEEVEVRVRRRDLAEAKVEAKLERGGKLHAAGDRMIEPHLDQALADGERHEALRRLARDAELAGDLVLGVAGDVIEPACARGLVEPQSVVIGFSRHSVSRAVPRARRSATSSGSRAMLTPRPVALSGAPEKNQRLGSGIGSGPIGPATRPCKPLLLSLSRLRHGLETCTPGSLIRRLPASKGGRIERQATDDGKPVRR